MFFGGSPPQVGSSSGSRPGSPTDSGPSTGSGASGRWYPDYNAQWSLGKCVNEAPIPSGRPSYDTGLDCCQGSYGGQASGGCVSSLPQAPSAPSGSPPGTPGTPGLGESPQTPPTTRPPVSPTSDAGIIISSETFIEIENTLDSVKDEIDNKLFLYQTPGYQWIASSVYRYDDFKESLYVMATEGVAGKTFYIGESDVENGHVYGLVNIAAFLAQSMKETIQYDACDENSWDLVGGKYPLSNSCGQLGQSYQDYHCSPEEAHMECPVDPNMSIKGVTHAKWYGAPGPMFCGPKTEYPFSGFWDYIYECKCLLLLQYLLFGNELAHEYHGIYLPILSCSSFQATRDGPTRQNFAMTTKGKRQENMINQCLMLIQVSNCADISCVAFCIFQ